MMTEAEFLQSLAARENATVLELGTRRSLPDRPTHHRAWCHPSAIFIMSDFENGADVDIVSDIHALGFAAASLDFVICCSVFEHVQRPWLAAHEIARVLKPDGIAFVQTHQTFPIHGFPNDYWRYTTEALRMIFEDAGLETESAAYAFPARIFAAETPHSQDFPAFLNASIVARKPQGWTQTAGLRAMPADGRLRERVMGLETRLAGREAQIASLMSSASWRITAPLRRASLALANLKQS